VAITSPPLFSQNRESKKMSYSHLMYLHLIVVIGLAAQASWGGEEQHNLAPHGTFEEDVEGFIGWLPLGVVAEADPPGIQVVEGVAHSGKKALQIVPGPQGLVKGIVYFADYNGGEGKREVSQKNGIRGARTFAMRLDPSMTAITASLWVKGATDDTFSFSAVWTTRQDHRNPVVEIRRDVVKKSDREEDDWRHFEILAKRPSNAVGSIYWNERFRP
jgi:hypothetical protein